MANHPQRARIKDWAAHIRRFRRRHKLTQVQLAVLLTAGQATPVGESTIQRWETGDRTPPPYLKLALAHLAARLKRDTTTPASESTPT